MLVVSLGAACDDAATKPASDSDAGGDPLVDSGAVDGGSAQLPRRAPRTGPDAVTYQRDVRPILETNCVECHTEGGIGPSRLDDWSMVSLLGRSIVSAVEGGRMPPWPARDSCHELSDSRALSAADKELIVGWEIDGFLEGNVADYRAPVPRRRAELGAPSRTMTYAEPFTPAVNSDTYRCFYVGTLETDTYLTALDIIPGVRSEVHHVQLHRVGAASSAMVQMLDENAAGGGYPCNAGGVGAGVPSQNMFSYRPGSVAVVLNQGDAVYVRAGSALVLQIHYNTQFFAAGEQPAADQTRVALWTAAAGQPPEHVIFRTGLLSPLSGKGDGSIVPVISSSIPAGLAEVVGETTLPMSQISKVGSGTIGLGNNSGPYVAGEIVGMTPHAHSWARRMQASLTRESGAEECLIDVPRWDYGWQLDYMYRQGVPYGPNDRLHVQCDYDNSAENQPVIDGMRRPVQTVTYGENTLNEMCLHYLWLRFRYADFIAAAQP
jgi:hypothetical protein